MPSYSIVINEEPDGTGSNVVVPALDGCFTCGDTLVEAIANAHEAIDLYIESLVDQGRPVPGDVTTTITTVQVGAPLSTVSCPAIVLLRCRVAAYPFTYDSFSATLPSRTLKTSTPRMWPSPQL
ncbi:hypothetical protein BH20CHL1_BH20CHL1_01990 [soil metagenome]